jgi:hypothetical protein
VLTQAKISCRRESFHAASVTRAGGERSWISAAVSLSMTIIGPPHFGHSQRSLGVLLLDMSCSACGAEPSRCKVAAAGSLLGTYTSVVKRECRSTKVAM